MLEINMPHSKVSDMLNHVDFCAFRVDYVWLYICALGTDEDFEETYSVTAQLRMYQELEPITELLNSEKENPEKIRILKSETQDSKRVSLSMLPSLDVPKPKGDAILLGTLPDVPELRNQTSLENPNYLGTEEPGFFSAELNPLESKFRSSVKLLVMGDDYIYYSVSKKYLKSLISDYMQKI